MQNEKLNAALAVACQAARQAGNLAADIAYGVRREAEARAAAARLRWQAAKVEGQVDGKLMEVGELIYATHTGNPTDSDVLEGQLREIDELKVQLDDLSGAPGPCPVCGGAVRPGDRYCRSCGGKL